MRQKRAVHRLEISRINAVYQQDMAAQPHRNLLISSSETVKAVGVCCNHRLQKIHSAGVCPLMQQGSWPGMLHECNGRWISGGTGLGRQNFSLRGLLLAASARSTRRPGVATMMSGLPARLCAWAILLLPPKRQATLSLNSLRRDEQLSATC